MIERWSADILDNIEFAASDTRTHHFPFHFHEEFTVGISLTGLQQFDLLDASYIVPPFSIILINPGQMHAHYPVNDIGWSHRSMYINPDLMAYLQKKYSITPADHHSGQIFDHFLIRDEELISRYRWIYDKNARPGERDLGKWMGDLFARQWQERRRNGDAEAGHEPGGNPAGQDRRSKDRALPERIIEMKNYLSGHTEEKLQLDRLAKVFHIDKFQLIRQFKKHTGVTPNAYLTIVRIEKAKKLIDLDFPIVQAALEAGFYDQSHFHHQFRLYTSFTPGEYQKRRNILQDHAEAAR